LNSHHSSTDEAEKYFEDEDNDIDIINKIDAINICAHVSFLSGSG
jgi:hypothetical protein